MDPIEKNLVPGETVRYKTRLHWIVLAWFLFVGLLLDGIGLASSIGGYEAQSNTDSALIAVGVLFVIGAGVLVAAGFIRRNATEVAVSNMWVLIKTVCSLETVLRCCCRRSKASALMNQSWAILEYGSVIVRGTGGTFEAFSRIARPNEFRKQVRQQMGTVTEMSR